MMAALILSQVYLAELYEIQICIYIYDYICTYIYIHIKQQVTSLKNSTILP